MAVQAVVGAMQLNKERETCSGQRDRGEIEGEMKIRSDGEKEKEREKEKGRQSEK